MNKNVFSINDYDDTADDLLLQQSSTKVSAHSSRNASRTSLTQNKNLFDAYENQIIKNIQSIRRNSNSSGGSSGGGGGASSGNQKLVGDGGRRRGSSSGGSEVGGGGSRRSSNVSNGSLTNKKITPTAKQLSPSPSKSNEKNKDNDDDDDDDDDDIFSGSSQLVKQVGQVNARASSLTNLKGNSSGHLEKQANLDYTDDISFNDDYGETEENNNNSSMLKTKTFGQKSGAEHKQKAPMPIPRAKIQEIPKNKIHNEIENDDSDQNFDLDEDYGGDEDEEDDDKF